MSTVSSAQVGECRRAGAFRAVAGALRYRFFLVAGIFPYLLGAAAAYGLEGAIDWWLLSAGLAGVVFVSIGIEGMNEYFDSRIGGDRVFASAQRQGARWHLPVGLCGFALALAVGLYLATVRGWPVMGFALLGGAAALSYLLPPVHLSYRGFGEAVIAVAYGLGLTLGSFYLQTGGFSWQCALAGMVPALLMFAMALANEIPDYYGDRLVGKRNLIVRVGQRRGVLLYALGLGACICVITAGLLLGAFGWPLVVAVLALVPLAWVLVRSAVRSCESALRFSRVIRGTIVLYIFVNVVAIWSYLV
ncbi:MAG: prenyltransferase [Planctomycetia bacterium]|nr:prenyltransferase [Planctomycetia bacterium]